jgi:hypothetical protein
VLWNSPAAKQVAHDLYRFQRIFLALIFGDRKEFAMAFQPLFQLYLDGFIPKGILVDDSRAERTVTVIVKSL